jgi:DNA invertase Pin-like site-specific DNA recombinase
MRIDNANPKCDRALALREKGIEPTAIAARLGIPLSQVYRAIAAGKKRRERKAKEDAA